MLQNDLLLKDSTHFLNQGDFHKRMPKVKSTPSIQKFPIILMCLQMKVGTFSQIAKHEMQEKKIQIQS
jgi:hypothetical protein